MTQIKKVAVLTGGGDCPGLNAVIRAIAKTSIKRFGLEVIGIEDGFAGMVLERWRKLTDYDVSGILPRGGTILGTTNRDNPFDFETRLDDGTFIREDRSDEAISNLRNLGVDALIVIGGDGTNIIANKIYRKGFPVVGVPKTIDNDLLATDITFGFDTALSTATEAIDKLHTTAASHHRIMVIEVMGRNTGWIALKAGMAGGADVILIPEIRFSYEKIIESIMNRKSGGKRFSIVVIAEGCELPNGGQVYRDPQKGVKPLGGVGEILTYELDKRTHMETRLTVLGHLQRGGTPTAFDRVLATRFGVKSVEMVVEGNFGMMACLKTPNIESVPIEEAVKEQRKVPSDGELIRFARSVGTSFGD